jgi:hypothetical protein
VSATYVVGRIKRRGLPVVLFWLALNAASEAQTTTDVIRGQIVDDVREVCTQPATQGQHWTVVGDVNGLAGVDVRVLKVGASSGNLHFTREEWSGVQKVLAADQAHDNDSYRHCVETITPLFTAKSGTHFSDPYKEACMHGDLSLAVSACKHYASIVFLQCNQFSMECKLRANCWSDKQRAMYLVLDACEGTNGDRSRVNAQLCSDRKTDYAVDLIKDCDQ